MAMLFVSFVLLPHALVLLLKLASIAVYLFYKPQYNFNVNNVFSKDFKTSFDAFGSLFY